jgi:hypothetical protein
LVSSCGSGAFCLKYRFASGATKTNSFAFVNKSGEVLVVTAPPAQSIDSIRPLGKVVAGNVPFGFSGLLF